MIFCPHTSHRRIDVRFACCSPAHHGPGHHRHLPGPDDCGGREVQEGDEPWPTSRGGHATALATCGPMTPIGGNRPSARMYDGYGVARLEKEEDEFTLLPGQGNRALYRWHSCVAQSWGHW